MCFFVVVSPGRDSSSYARSSGRWRESSSSEREKTTVIKKMKEAWQGQKVSDSLRPSITIPGKIACHPPALAILLLIGVFNGLVNMILSSLGSVFQFQYRFSPTTAGLPYIGLGLGGVLGLAATPRVSDFFAKYRPHPAGSQRPEHALPMMIIAGLLASVGLFWYGWSTETKMQCMVPILGLGVFGFGYTSMRVSHNYNNY
jgi:hypothetical protein